MTTELLINNTDAATYGVRMGDKFIDALELPVALKEPITNESRLEHGTRMIFLNKVASRDVTLNFSIRGSSKADYETKKNSFVALLKAGPITLNIPSRSSDVYTLTYRNSTEYAHSIDGRIGKLTVKFVEYNPASR